MNKVCESRKAFNKTSFLFNKNFLAEVIGSDFMLGAYCINAFHEFKNKVMINFIIDCNEVKPLDIERKIGEKVTVLPKFMVGRDKKTTIMLYIVDNFFRVRSVVAYKSAVVRELLYPSYTYNNAAVTTLRMTLEYSSKEYINVDADDPHYNDMSDIYEQLNDINVFEKCKKKEYAESIIKNQNKMLENAKKTTKTYYTTHKMTVTNKEKDEVIENIDKAIDENNKQIIE